MKIPREERDLLYNEALDDALKRLRDQESRVRGLVMNVTVSVEDLRFALQEIDNLRSRLDKQVY